MRVVDLAGLGLIGKQRAGAIRALSNAGLPVRLGRVFDPRLLEGAGSKELDSFLDAGHRPTFVRDFSELIDGESDLLVIACPHDVAAHYAIAALRAGKTVLMEKPMGRSIDDAEAIAAEVRWPGQFFAGFTYRQMAGVRALVADAAAGWFGDLVSASMHLGHGGRPGDESSWKLDPERAGGGALLDPGIHLFDLASLVAPEELRIKGVLAFEGFWKTGIDEEAHVLLTSGAAIFSLQASVVRWRSTFSILVNGTDGYGVLRGRGRHYGSQTYSRGRRWAWVTGRSQADSEELVVTTDCESVFADELAAVLGIRPSPSIRLADHEDALASMHLCTEALEALRLAGR